LHGVIIVDDTAAPKVSSAHPLDPGRRTKLGRVDLLKAEGKSTHYGTASSACSSPRKTPRVFKEGDPIVRRVKTVCYDTKNNATIEGVVNVTANKIEARGAGAQAPANSGIDARFIDRSRGRTRGGGGDQEAQLDPVEIRSARRRSAAISTSRRTATPSRISSATISSRVSPALVVLSIIKRTVDKADNCAVPMQAGQFLRSRSDGKPRPAVKPPPSRSLMARRLK
jgi:hypothetical protein